MKKQRVKAAAVFILALVCGCVVYWVAPGTRPMRMFFAWFVVVGVMVAGSCGIILQQFLVLRNRQ
jgi:hypothetical protein